MINLEKSSITFGNRVYQHTRDNIMRTLQIPNTGGGGKYLGLPEQFGRKKKDMLQYIQERVQQKIDGWQTRFLSAAGKETLIKAVAYAMPVYSMNCFQLPMELCSEIDSMIARFWWGSTKDKRKISWVAWRKLVTSKKTGGLGFRDIHLFNQALLANQVWKIIQRPNSLLYRLLKGRYFRDGSMFSATRGTQPSYGWNSLRFGRDLLQTRIQVNIGNGRTTQLGVDPWLPTTPPRPPKLMPGIDPEIKVMELINHTTHQWDEDQLMKLIQPEDHHLIRKLYLLSPSRHDTYIWSPMKSGIYTVKSGYWTTVNLSIDETTPPPPLMNLPDIATNIWKLHITPKLKHFLWRTASRAIGVAENLRRRNINVNPHCSRCCTAIEIGDHALFSCPQVMMIWRAAGLPTTQLCNHCLSIEDKFRYLFQMYGDLHIDRVTRNLPFWLLWRIWKNRNDLVFNRKRIDPIESVNQAYIDTKEWLDNIPTTESFKPGNRASTRRKKWSRPQPGWLKCNYDASHHEGDRDSGLGWIIRNAHGTFLNCGMGKFHGRPTSEEAECTTLIWALQCTWGLGYMTVEFEGDNLNIVNLINGSEPNPRLQHYMDTIRLWKRMFTSIVFSYQSREQNSCADTLAKKAVISANQSFMYHSCPNFLLTPVNSDLSLVH